MTLPSLAHTVEWMVPLIRHLHEADVPHPPWQKQLPYRILQQPFTMTLTDVPIKSKSKIMPFYYARERELASALEAALGPEWLVKSLYNPDPETNRSWLPNYKNMYINGTIGDRDVIIAPEMCVMLFDKSGGYISSGITLKSGAQYQMRLHCHRFESESHKTAYLICQ